MTVTATGTNTTTHVHKVARVRASGLGTSSTRVSNNTMTKPARKEMGPSAKVRAVNIAAKVATAIRGNRSAGSAVSMSSRPKTRRIAKVTATKAPTADVTDAFFSSLLSRKTI